MLKTCLFNEAMPFAVSTVFIFVVLKHITLRVAKFYGVFAVLSTTRKIKK